MLLHLYTDRDSAIHRLHPVVRVLGMGALFVSAFVVERPAYLVPVAAVVLALLAATGALGNVRRLRVLFVMVFVMTFVIWTFFFGPDGRPPLFAWGRVLVSATAPWFALGMAVKLTIFLGAGVLFLSTTRIEDFAYALTVVGVPYKIGFTLTLAFRLVPVFLDAAHNVVQAQRCRGLDFEQGGLLRRLRRYVPVIIPVFMGALRRADTMAMALEARGFQSTRPRTALQRYTVGVPEVLAVVLVSAMTAVYVVLWWSGVVALRGG